LRPSRTVVLLAGALLLVFVLATVLPAAEELRCAICGQSISGRYLEDSGRTYHERCYELFRAPKCAVCGRAISESRIELEGKSYHETCYREAKQPRCAACGKSIEGTYLIAAGRNYHPACHRGLAIRCAVCGQPLEESYVEDGWGNAFHARHGREGLCPFCGRVMSPSTTRGSFISSSNGIRICALCAGRAVSRGEEVERTLERVRVRLLGIFPVPPGSFSWELVDRFKLLGRAPAGTLQGNELGVTRGERRRSAGGVTRQIRISLLSGIPDWLLGAVAAHEMVHVWQQMQDLDSLPPDQAEGSAEYAAYLLLKEGRTQEGRVKIEAMEKSRDPAYGSGFRRALRAAESGPTPARLREILEKGRGWPSVP